jgi:prepilin peptidase CpaA
MVGAAQFAAFIIFPLGLAFAAAYDLLTMTIPNKLTLGLLAAFVVLAPLSGLDWQTYGMHFVVGAAVLAIAFTCFSFGWVGGGDAKLAAVAALWIGWPHAVSFIVIASVFGAVLTIFILTFRRSPLPAFVRLDWVQRLYDAKAGVPYGIALAAAGLTVYPHVAWVMPPF